jgi:adenylate cyclase
MDVLFPIAVIDKLIGDEDLWETSVSVHSDFTAVGNVVNSASRLQGQASGGEIIVSERVAVGLSDPVGDHVTVELKGKSEPQDAYRVTVM